MLTNIQETTSPNNGRTISCYETWHNSCVSFCESLLIWYDCIFYIDFCQIRMRKYLYFLLQLLMFWYKSHNSFQLVIFSNILMTLFSHVSSINGLVQEKHNSIANTLRRAANPQKVLYLRSLMHPHTHLVCNAHLIANFLSFHMRLVVAMNCGAGNALRGFEISNVLIFLKLYFIHIFKDIRPLRAQNAIKQCK